MLGFDHETILSPASFHGVRKERLAQWPRICDPKTTKTSGEYFQKNWVGMCGTLPETLPLLRTKMCDFQSINQSIYLVRQYVRWGCPDYTSQGLVYKTHDNKNTKLIKIQYIWLRNNLKRSVINVWKQITIIYPLMLKATPSRIPLNKLKTKNRKNKFKTTDVVKP